MPDFGGRAIPGISFRIGSSHSDLSQMKGDLQGIKDMLQQVQDEAKQATASLNAVAAKRSSTGSAAKAPVDAAYQEAVDSRRAAQRQETVRRASDPLEQQYAQHTATQRTARMQQALNPPPKPVKPPPSELETQYRAITEKDRQKTMEEAVKRGTTKDTSLLGRGMNALSWSPFMPQSTYMTQMMLGEMGLGLSMPMMAAGMGIAGLGVAGLGLNAFTVNAQRTGQQTIAATGAPPFNANTFSTGTAEAQLLEQRAGQLHLTGPQTQQGVSALAAGGLDATKAFGEGLDQTATLVNAFGMSIQDAANFVTTMQVQMGRSTDATAASIAAFGKVAQATDQPLAALGQIAQQTPNMLTNLNGPGLAVAASVARAMAGSTQGGIALQSVANASGAQALSIAAQMGKTDQQFNAMQTDPSGAGQKQIDDFAVGLIKQSMAQSGGATDQAMMVANARLGTSFDKATFMRLANLGPNVSTDAFNKALNAPTPPLTPGNLNSQVANGGPGATLTANPWNVKDVTLNAANVLLTGAIAGTQNGIGAAGGLGAVPGDVLSGLGRLLFGPSDLSTGLGIGVPVPGIGVPTPNVGTSPTTPGGGGSNGANLGTVTINLTNNGQRIASIPVAIQNGRASQQYQQYVGRGQ